MRKALGWTLLAVLVLLLLPAAVSARPGGGEGYGGGGGDGGGGDDGGFAWLLIRLWIEFVIAYPAIGVPATIVIVIFLVIRHKRKQKAGPQNWDSARTPSAPPSRPPSRDLDGLRTLDPAFSVVLFEDFVYALYARAHQARSSARDLESLSPYLSPAARAHLAQRPPAGAPVSGVVVGALRVLDLSMPPMSGATPAPPGGQAPQVSVTLEFESNMTVGGSTTQYVKERWRLVRDAGVRSKPPAKVRTFNCPNCGAPFGPEGGDRCEFCGQVVSGGKFDWSVQAIELLKTENRPPALTTNVQEVGTSWPTVFHRDLNARWAELVREDPAITQEALHARLQLIYNELNAGWTRGDLKGVRPFVSDGLFDYLQYWMTSYRQQGVRNVLEGMRLAEWKLARLVRDASFDSLTFRIWGSGRDFMARQKTGEVVSGDPHTDRFYSEYWTLIRGSAVRGAPRADKSCPHCGASLDVNMAGECEHCGTKVTSGDFDWVLSKIEQDDSYTG
jgi:hypothetical protein